MHSERAILPALLRPPCLVSFSGGRDSAAVLATATALARREGLPVPIPATNVFSSDQDADESSWQETLVRHLGLSDWIRIEHTDELDLIGPYAKQVLTVTRAGLARERSFPSSAARSRARRLDAHRDRWGRALHGGQAGCVPPRCFLGRCALVRETPSAWRSRSLQGRCVGGDRPTRDARCSVAPAIGQAARHQRLASEAAAEPRRLDASASPGGDSSATSTLASRRSICIARDTETLIVHPLLSPALLEGGRHRGRTPTASPTATDGVRRLFGDLLPPAIVERKLEDELRQGLLDRARACVRARMGRLRSTA